MKNYQKFKFSALSALFVSCICLFSALSVQADMPAAEEWVDIPVVVNIIDASDANKVDDAIKKANEILKQAHIRLVVKKTNDNVNVGNGDGNLTAAEGDTAQEEGQKELDKVCGAGKGIKITVADDCWTEDPNTAGWSVHRNPVIVIEPDTDANEMGERVTHELLHSLTVTAHSNDVNDVMYKTTAGNGIINPNDVNEVFPNAKKRGTPYFIIPRVPPGGAVAIPISFDFSIDAHGAKLDDFNDLNINDPCGLITDSNDPTIQYADLREIIVFSDEPFDPCSIFTHEIQFGGPFPVNFPVDSFFNITYEFDSSNPGPEARIEVQVNKDGNSVNTQALWIDLWLGGPDVNLPPPILREDEKFDGSSGPIIANHSLQVTAPIELIELSLHSVEPIIIDVNSEFHDYRYSLTLPVVLQDSAGSFNFSLTKPCTCPGIFFTPDGISGCGFSGGVGIELDGELIGSTTALADGTFMYFMDTTLLEPGLHSVIAKELDDSGLTGAAYAAGNFNYCPGGGINGDFDGDCDVDFYDFTFIAINWLKDTTTP